MLKKIKHLFMGLATVLVLAVPAMVPAVAHADIKTDLCSGVDTATGGTDCATDTTDADSPLNKIIKTVIKIFSILVGAVSVIMIVLAGFKYITSGGDSGKVGSAKNTLVFAIIGLIIVALAQIIVRFVLTNAKA